jgi:hypothetical protein
MKEKIDTIVQLAMEVAKTDPIDWGMLSMNEEDSYRLIAMSIADNPEFDDPQHGSIVMKATIVKLVVENMVLNIKLLSSNKTT